MTQYKEMNEAMAKYVIETMHKADKKDPATIAVVAELIKASKDIIF